MTPAEFLEIIHTSEKLKDTMRHCYTSQGRRESVAEHSWRITLMAYFLQDQFPEADMFKIMKMCVIHDMGEIFTGDIPVFAKTAQNEKTEEQLLYDWVDSLPSPYNTDMKELYEEMRERKTIEAKIYKALDSLEALISHNESDLSTWEDHEYDLQMVYADDRVTFSKFMTELREVIREETREKIRTEGGRR